MTEGLPSLHALYASHVGKLSDKWQIYIAQYGRLFEEFRSKPVRLLEIGIQNGGSLDIWSRYFPSAQVIVGCDIDPNCASLKYDDPRIRIVVGDAASEGTQSHVLQHSESFDLVVDDGSHRSSDIIGAFARYFPVLAEGGVFVVEDLHCSYWKQFEGGLFDPTSSIAFFKRLADVLNHEHWGVDKSCADLLSGFRTRYGHSLDDDVLQHVHSVEFINSMCVVRKRSPEHNRLGKRVIAGSVEAVAGGHVAYRGMEILPNRQVNNEWSVLDSPPNEEAARDARVGELIAVVGGHDARLAKLADMASDGDRRAEHAERALAQRDELMGALMRTVAERDSAIERGQATLVQGAADNGESAAQLNATRMQLGDAMAIVALRAAELEVVRHDVSRLEQLVDECHKTMALRDAEFHRQLNAAEQALAEREAKVTALGSVIGERDAALLQLTASLDQRAAAVAELQRTLGERDARVGELIAILGERDSRLAKITDAATDGARRADRAEQALAQRDELLGSLMRTVAERDAAVEREQASAAQRAADSGELALQLNAANTKLGDAVAAVALGNAAIEAARCTVAAHELQVGELTRAVALREGELERQIAGRRELERAIAELQQTIGHRDARLEGINSSLAAAQKQTAEQLDALRTSADHLEQSKALAAAQAGEIAALRGAVHARDGELALAHQALAALEAGRWSNRLKRQLGRLHLKR